MPRGAVDTHYHIFDGPSELATNRSYTPNQATQADYANLQSILGFDRSVVIQPSIYGTDNRTTLSHASASPDRRAIAVLHHIPTADEIAAMAAQNCTGLRINALFKGAPDLTLASDLAQAIADHGWHLQFLINVSDSVDLLDQIEAFPVPIVIDHFGHPSLANSLNDEGIQKMLRLLGSGKAYVKLSAPYRLSPRYSDCMPVITAMIAENPDRLLWGTDWPHPSFDGRMPNDGELVDLIPDWLPSADLQQKVLIENPQTLYGFDPIGESS